MRIHHLLNSENALGEETNATTGAFSRTYGYDAYGLPTSRTAGSFQNFSYGFDAAKGNLAYRKDNTSGIQENFTYDDLNRLTGYGSHTAAYDLTGNITRKSDAGSTFSYGIQGKPYAVSGISTEGNAIPQRNQTIGYTSFKRPDTVAEGAYSASFVYNAGGDRVKMEIKKDGNSELRRYYLAGQYELDEGTAGTKEKLYLGGDYYSAFAVYVKENGGSWQVYYICRDYLGSITHITNSSGSVVQQLSYDAWGRLRNPANQTAYAPDTEPALFLGRGYTGHEHLAMFGLVNMNARLYDPAVGRFLSPDPYLQAPDFSQNFNRYSYALNNPLKYTDPNGEFFLSTITTGILGFVGAVGRSIGAWFVGFDDPNKAGKMFGNAWKDYGKQMSNAWKIDMGIIRTDPNKSKGGRVWELISRLTWQLPQTLIGNLVMTGGNVAYQVNNVTYGYGMTAVDWGGGEKAVTIGYYSAGPKGYKADWHDHLFVHEYGHYIQSQQHGPAYLLTVGLPSLQSAVIQKKDNPNSPQHDNRWFEADASHKGAEYFDKYYGSKKDGYKERSQDYFDRNSFIDGTPSPYLNHRTEKRNRSGNPISSKFHWTDIPVHIPILGFTPAIFY